jgi:hypothetical protein
MIKCMTVIFSHGFGVGKDDRGLFTGIAQGLQLDSPIMFDYGSRNGQEVTFPPLREQAKMLEEKLREVFAEDPKAEPTLICHSQGCVVAALANTTGVKRAIFLAPPMRLDLEWLKDFFGSREGSVVRIDGESRLMRRDGTTTVVGPEYWKDLREVDPIEVYNDMAQPVDITMIIASQDEVLGDDAFSATGALSEKIGVRELAGNHDFTGTSRSVLISLLQEEL